jgi:hypothetical protein
MKEYSYKSYQYDVFCEHYFKYDRHNPFSIEPEKILVDCFDLIPSYVDTFIQFGCANGRDFIPFQDNFQCIGFDLAPLGYIEWVCKTKNLTYNQCSIEDYLDHFDHSNEDLSKCLVYTQGTLMYASEEYQNRFIQHLLDHNCKNIIIHEYPPEYAGPHEKFNPDPKYVNMFERKHFRPLIGDQVIEDQPTGFIYLNK